MDKVTEEVFHKYTRSAWTIFGIGCFTYFMILGLRMIVTTIAPFWVEEFSLTTMQATMITSAFFYSYTVMQIPGGIIADKWGGRKTITVCMVGIGLCQILFGVASSYGTIIAFRLVLGIISALGFVPLMALMNRWFIAKRRALATSTVTAMGTLGTAVFAMAAPVLVKAVGCHELFYISSIPAFISAVLCWFFFRDTPEAKGFPMMAELEKFGGSIPASAKTQSDPNPPAQAKVSLGAGYKALIKKGSMWIIAIQMMLVIGAFYGLPILVPLTAVGYLGLSKETAGLMVMSFMVVGIASAPVAGGIADRTGSRKWTVFIGTALSAIFLTIFAALLKPGCNVGLLITLLVLIGFFAMFCVPNYVLAAEVGGLAFAGMAIGLVNTFGTGIGPSVIPTVGGWMVDKFSYPAAFWFFAGIMWLAAIVQIFVKEKRIKKA